MTQKQTTGRNCWSEKFSQFEAAAPQPKWLPPLRKAGIASFAEAGFPDAAATRTGASRTSRRSPNCPFSSRAKPPSTARKPKPIDESVFAKLPGHRLVFVNGFFSAKLSSIKPVAGGVRIENLSAALAKDSALIEKHLGKYAHTANNTFAALNQAFFSDGAFIFVPQGVAVAEPVQLIYISSAKKFRRNDPAAQPRHRRGEQQIDGRGKLHQHRQCRVFHQRRDGNSRGRQRRRRTRQTAGRSGGRVSHRHHRGRIWPREQRDRPFLCARRKTFAQQHPRQARGRRPGMYFERPLPHARRAVGRPSHDCRARAAALRQPRIFQRHPRRQIEGRFSRADLRPSHRAKNRREADEQKPAALRRRHAPTPSRNWKFTPTT